MEHARKKLYSMNDLQKVIKIVQNVFNEIQLGFV